MIVLVYGGIFILNAVLQSQYIFGGDSAEFALAALTWSIPHPPGYPLFSLMANILRHIPLGTVPWRVALISSFSASVTAYCMYRLLVFKNINRLIALVSSILFLVLFPVWQYSLIPEVFLLNTALVSAATYTLFVYEKTKNPRLFSVFSFILGLASAHHHIYVLFIPAWYLVIKDVLPTKPRRYLNAALFFLIGFSAYLYAPLASLANPPIDWENAKTIDGFIKLFLRTTYGTFSAYSNSKSAIATHVYDLIAIFIFVIQDFKIPGVLIFLMSVGAVRKIGSKLAAFTVVAIIIHLLFLTYTNFVLTYSFTAAMFERFLISFYFVLAILFGMTIDWLIKKIPRFALAVYLFAITYCLVLAISNFKTIVRIRSVSHFDRIARDILATVPQGGIAYAATDNTNFPVLYYLYGLKNRQDIVFLHMSLLNRKPYVDRLRTDPRIKGVPNKPSLRAADFETIFLKNEDKGIYMETPLPAGYWMPYGLLWKYYSTEQKAVDDIPHLLTVNRTLWNTVYNIPVLSAEEKNLLHLQVVQDFYREAYVNYAKFLFLAKHYSESLDVMKKAHSLTPSDKIEMVTLLNIAGSGALCSDARTYYDYVMQNRTELTKLGVQFESGLKLYKQKCTSPR
jgi:hypothetical protein